MSKEENSDRYIVEIARPDIGYNHPKFGGWVIATKPLSAELIPTCDQKTANNWDDILTKLYPQHRYRIRKLDGPAHTT